MRRDDDEMNARKQVQKQKKTLADCDRQKHHVFKGDTDKTECQGDERSREIEVLEAIKKGESRGAK